VIALCYGADAKGVGMPPEDPMDWTRKFWEEMHRPLEEMRKWREELERPLKEVREMLEWPAKFRTEMQRIMEQLTQLSRELQEQRDKSTQDFFQLRQELVASLDGVKYLNERFQQHLHELQQHATPHPPAPPREARLRRVLEAIEDGLSPIASPEQGEALLLLATFLEGKQPYGPKPATQTLRQLAGELTQDDD
jgi:hypothetical protein